MATIYNIQIKTVSPFVNYTEQEIENLFKQFLLDYKNPTTGLKFESTEIIVEKQESQIYVKVNNKNWWDKLKDCFSNKAMVKILKI